MAGGVTLTTAVLTLFYGARWPLAAWLAMVWTTLAGVVVVAAAATRRGAYAWRGLFHKSPVTGIIPWQYVLLMWPYHLCVNIVCWGYRQSAHENIFDKVAGRLYLGGWPLRPTMLPSANTAILDCSNELLRRVSVPAYKPVLVFESWAPEKADMEAAVEWALAQQAEGRDVFCHCTHGHGRSAVTACAILLAMEGAATPEEALAKVIKVRPGVKPNRRQVAMLKEWAAARAHKD